MTDALIAGAALLVLAVLWYIFLRGGNGGCTAHHFVNYEDRVALRSRTLIPGQRHLYRHDYKVTVARKAVASCEHGDCTATDTEWREIETIEKDF